MARRSQYGSKKVQNQYDPQITEAARASAATAARAQQFAEDYYTKVVTPMNEKMMAASEVTQSKLNRMYDLNAEQMEAASARYQKYGVPAENRYYDMVSEYSAPAEQERQAALAKGDLGVAMRNQEQARMRQFGGLGIDPTSPAAISAATDASVMNAAAEAGAMNRARGAARELGMKLTSDAANFGRGGQSGILQFGGAAQGNTQGAFGTAQGALGSAMGAGGFVNQGYNTALQGYGQNLGAYTSLGNTSMNTQAQQQAAMMSGLGSMAGALGGAALGGGGIFGKALTAAPSDVRLKQNIKHIGDLKMGVKLYSFEYKPEFQDELGHGTFVGVMAQELIKVMPEAVSFRPDGYMLVNYEMLG